MRANSTPVISGQTGIDERLTSIVAKHAATQFLKPITAYNRAAYDQGIAAWHAAGDMPLILDAGCGVGISTLYLATKFPDHFVIGVDQSADRLARNTVWLSALPSNYVHVRADLIDYWRLMQAAGIRLARHYLLYPNPWPKLGHVTRRWHGHAVFPSAVALGGHFECRSNWRIYVEECATALTQLACIDVAVESYLPHALPSSRNVNAVDEMTKFAITPFEKKYLASGHALWRCIAHLE